jgi:ABC-type uncharacterized transport system substrate-binding protein
MMRALMTTALLVFGLGMPLGAPPLAHPHASITLKTSLKLNADGRASMLHQVWTFDPLYTAFVLEGVAETPALAAQVVREVAEENLRNLGEYAYFTEIRLGGVPIVSEPATNLTTALVESPNGARLQMAFSLPFATPLDLSDGTLVYAVFDPSFYIDMRHKVPSDARLEGGDGCALEMHQSEPSQDVANLAAALDKDAEPIPTLGRHFAQFVEVACR